MTKSAEITRFGQTFYVLTNLTRRKAITADYAQANAVATFDFDGPATRKNPSCVAAFDAAVQKVGELVRT